MKIYKLLIPLFMLGMMACEEAPPSDYIPQTFVEAFLYVDQPIERIILQTSQPLTDSFQLENSLIRDADVRIIEVNKSNKTEIEFLLQFRNNNESPGYYYPDTDYKIKPNTLYKFWANVAGNIITGETTTPDRINWIKPLKDTLQYPLDSLNVPSPDSLEFTWNKIPGIDFYMIRVMCLDTLEYGLYLSNNPEEKNRRVYRPWEENSPFYNELTRWGLIPSNKPGVVTSPVVWNSIKWYGKNEITVYAPDFNYLKWFLHYTRTREYQPLLESVSGALGVFGSASLITTETFVLKNQP